MFARYADSLQLGCDCLGDIHYLDAVVADDLGNPRTITNAICLHEEDHGVLWKHTDIFTGAREVRRQRRLVMGSPRCWRTRPRRSTRGRRSPRRRCG